MKSALKPLSTATVIASSAALSATAAEADTINDLITKIKSSDEKVRGPAWQGAAPLGAPAVKPLVAVMADNNFEIARAAKRALWKIVRHAGRPGADNEAAGVTAELTSSLGGSQTAPVRRELLWMLSEIGSDEAVPPMASLLADAEVRDDARCCLQRMPGQLSLAALKQAFASAPEEFKYALAESLRARGEKVSGYASRKLVPSKQTRVQPVGA